jgi:hypothetical protein
MPCFPLTLVVSCDVSKFVTYNWLHSSLWIEMLLPISLIRHAVIGLVASIVSDTTVNGIRVVKTIKQSLASKSATLHNGTKNSLGYGDIIYMVFASEGILGFFRGLDTRILTNAIQSIVFTIIWRGLADRKE